MTTKPIIRVSIAPYSASPPFPEAAYYPDFVASRLADFFPCFAVEADNHALATTVSIYEGGKRVVDEWCAIDDDNVATQRFFHDLVQEITGLVKVELWDEFCAEGYRDYTGNHDEP